MATKIIVYTKDNCPKCNQVKWALNAAGAEYEVRNIDADYEYSLEHKSYGYDSVPLTVFPSGKELVGFDFGKFEAELGK